MIRKSYGLFIISSILILISCQPRPTTIHQTPEQEPEKTIVSELVGATVEATAEKSVFDKGYIVFSFGLHEGRITNDIEDGIQTGNSLGVYLLDLRTKAIERLLNDDFTLLDYSPDGKNILVCKGNILYFLTIKSNQLNEISNDLFSNEDGLVFALWLKDINQVAYVGKQENEFTINLFDPTQNNVIELTNSSSPMEIYPTNDENGLLLKKSLKDISQYTNYITYEGQDILKSERSLPAFSTSSKTTIEYGRRRMASVIWPASSYPT